MKKYIDAELLKEKIDEVRQDWLGDSTGLEVGEEGAELGAAESILDSLDEIITSLQQDLPIHQDGRFVFPKFLYARTLDNKTIDVSYAPQDMNAIEYIRNDSVEEQPGVDLEKEIEEYFPESDFYTGWNYDDVTEVARDFWNKGYNKGYNEGKEEWW